MYRYYIILMRILFAIFLFIFTLAIFALIIKEGPSTDTWVGYGLLATLIAGFVATIDIYRGNWTATGPNEVISMRGEFWLGVFFLCLGFGLLYLIVGGKIYADNDFWCEPCRVKYMGRFLNDLRDTFGAWLPRLILQSLYIAMGVLGIFLVKSRLLKKLKALQDQ